MPFLSERQTLSEMWSLSDSEVVRRVVNRYDLITANRDSSEAMRRDDIAKRLRLYRNDAVSDYNLLIKEVFEHPQVQEHRRRISQVARHQNVTQRIVHEVASLYSGPARRRIGSNAAQYAIEMDALSIDQVMKAASRLVFLCNEVLLWATTKSDGSKRLRVVTPDLFDAIPDEECPTDYVAIVIHRAPSIEQSSLEEIPNFEIWDEESRYLVGRSGQLIRKEVRDRSPIPGVLMHSSHPVDRLLDSRPGRDIMSAHLAVFLINLMTMRLAKSQGERQPVVSGDLAMAATGQPLDGETPLRLPPGSSISMLESRTDPGHYIAIKKDVIASVAQAYGMSYDQLAYNDSEQSGRAYMARRTKLNELREEQRGNALKHERELATLLGYDGSSLSVDFRESGTPTDEADDVALLRDRSALGVDSPVQYVQRKNPDLTPEEALAYVVQCAREWESVRALLPQVGAPPTAPDASGLSLPR